VARAVAWTWHNARRFGGDPRRIVVAGHSAGGQLAAMLLACQWPQLDPVLPRETVRSALSISGLHDLEPMMHTPFLQPTLQLTPEQVEQASPARLPAPRAGTLYSVVGGEESPEFQRQNRLIQEAWGTRRVPVCETLPGAAPLQRAGRAGGAEPPPAAAGAGPAAGLSHQSARSKNRKSERKSRKGLAKDAKEDLHLWMFFRGLCESFAAFAFRMSGCSAFTSTGARPRCRRRGSRSSPSGCPSASSPRHS
jgi:pimeloyl-ACP methyl ester carboxylesterase